MSKTKNSISNNKEHSSASSCTSSSMSSDEEIDARDLKPIRDYLSNRKELARQLFKSVKPEKIRLMLPQVLKQMDLSELEEWCETELNGMSKARILSILNGKPMLESSDTSEYSDDSGPSLEIISDTEEWLTDDDISKKEYNGKGKLKKDKTKTKNKTHINKKNNVNKPNVKIKSNIKTEDNDKSEDVKVKKEDDKDKGKEGDSLLDLLELEMRARAIRALIRKEEDIIPSNSSQINDSQSVESNTRMSEDDKAKKNCREQLERIIGSQQSNKGEDEDVVLVIPKPAPVVELLSSDSDEQELKNKCTNEKSIKNSNENSKTISQNLKQTQETVEMRSDTNTVSNTSKTIMPERNVDIKNNILSISISADNVAEKRKKSKKKSRKSQLAATDTNSLESKQFNVTDVDKSNNGSVNVESIIILSDDNKINKDKRTEQKVLEESKIEEEKSIDLDDIDLDDYCEVMDIENSDEDKSQDKVIAPSEQENKESVPTSETWASRYYQTDDVQNVIKESKIQSEIRKRLRERQRLSKLNKSPNLNLSAQPSASDATTTFEKTPTGSVEEYLALKRALNANISNVNNNIIQEQVIASTSNNNTNQDNPIINSDIDIATTSMSVRNESSFFQECTNDNAQETVISEVAIAKPAEIIASTENSI